MMELGALVCTPRLPQCEKCPWNTLCLAYKTDTVSQYPVKAETKPVPTRREKVCILQKSGKVLLVKREGQRLLEGMWELPSLNEELGIRNEELKKLGTVKHTYSHFKLELHVYTKTLSSKDVITLPHSRWVSMKNLKKYPISKAPLMAFGLMKKQKD